MAERFASVSEDELCEKFSHDIMNHQNLVSVLSAEAESLSLRLRQITQTSVLIIHDIMLNLIP